VYYFITQLQFEIFINWCFFVVGGIMKVHNHGFDYSHEQEREAQENMARLMVCLAPIFLFGIAFIGITVGTSANSSAILAVSASWTANVVLICAGMVVAYLSRKAAATGNEHGSEDKIKLGRDIRMTGLAIAAAIIIGAVWTRGQPAPLHSIEMAFGAGILWIFYLGLELPLEKSGANQYADERGITLSDEFGKWYSGAVAVGGFLIYMTGFNVLDNLLAYGVGICLLWEALAIWVGSIMAE